MDLSVKYLNGHFIRNKAPNSGIGVKWTEWDHLLISKISDD